MSATGEGAPDPSEGGRLDGLATGLWDDGQAIGSVWGSEETLAADLDEAAAFGGAVHSPGLARRRRSHAFTALAAGGAVALVLALRTVTAGAPGHAPRRPSEPVVQARPQGGKSRHRPAAGLDSRTRQVVQRRLGGRARAASRRAPVHARAVLVRRASPVPGSVVTVAHRNATPAEFGFER